jgi:hypothetical protein
VLDDYPVADDFARMVTDAGLVQRVLDVDTGGGEVGEVHHGREVEVALEVVSVVTPGEREQTPAWRAARRARRDIPCFASGETPSAHRIATA